MLNILKANFLIETQSGQIRHTNMASKVKEFLLAQDMFGQPIGVNYRGDDHFKTKLGACISILTYIVILGNLMNLGEAFLDGSR